MKVKRMLAMDRGIYNRLIKVCEDNSFYRNSFVVHCIAENIEEMNSYTVSDTAIRTKEKKSRFQIYIDEELYNSIKSSKIQRIERILDKELKAYE